jgi:3-hydroxyacyl-[acyl-carrier-protein] dehydratase
VSTSSNALEYRDLQRYLPHRYPFLLVDRVLAYEPSKMIRGVKNISSAEAYWRTIPKRRYPPGLILEAMGQLAWVLYSVGQLGSGRELLLGSLSGVQILRAIEQPDQLVMELWIDKEMDGVIVAHGTAATSEGPAVVLGQMIAMARSRAQPADPPGS